MKRMFTDFNNQQQQAIQETINDFLNTKKGKKTDETIEYYKYRLDEFAKYLEENEGSNDVQILSRAVVDRYIDFKREKNPNLSNQSLNNFLRAIRAFVNYCIKEGYIRYFTIEMFPSTRIAKKPYTNDEKELLLKKPDISKCSFPEYRNWVMVCHFLASGNRSKTVRHIKIKDIDMEKKRITLETTKNHESLFMPISDTYLPILREYLKIRKGMPDDYLFCNQYGKQFTASGLRTVMRKHNLKHGVSTTSLHKYRNTFAETWIMNDGNDKKLQYALGHKTPHMVDEYVDMYGKVLTKEFNDLSPLSMLREKLETKKKLPMQGNGKKSQTPVL